MVAKFKMVRSKSLEMFQFLVLFAKDHSLLAFGCPSVSIVKICEHEVREELLCLSFYMSDSTAGFFVQGKAYFCAYNSTVMGTLPVFVQMMFPVELTARGGVELTVLGMVKRDIVHGRSFSDICKALKEHQATAHAREHLAYTSYVTERKAAQARLENNWRGLLGSVLSEEVKAVPAFPPLTVYTPSPGYLIKRFEAWFAMHGDHFRRWLAIVDGIFWCRDWTFQDMRYFYTFCYLSCMFI